MVRGEAEDDLGRGVTDEQDVDLAAGQPAGGGGVVAGQAGEGLPAWGHILASVARVTLEHRTAGGSLRAHRWWNRDSRALTGHGRL